MLAADEGGNGILGNIGPTRGNGRDEVGEDFMNVLLPPRPSPPDTEMSKQPKEAIPRTFINMGWWWVRALKKRA